MKEWLDIQSDPGFAQLPDELQTLVRMRLEEGSAYIQLRDDLAAVPRLEQIRSLAASDGSNLD